MQNNKLSRKAITTIKSWKGFEDFDGNDSDFLSKDPEIFEGYEHTVLMEAVKKQDVDIVKYLIQAGANVNAINEGTQQSPLLCLPEKSKNGVKISNELIKAGADVNYIQKDEEVMGDDWFNTPLIYACMHGKYKLVKTLIKAGADVNLAWKNGLPAICMVDDESKYYINIIKALISAGADINDCDSPKIVAKRIGSKKIQDLPENSTEQTKEVINEISKGINFIGEITYKNFITAFNLSKDEFKDATKLEALIYALFLFDYVLTTKQIPQEFRQKFYEKCTANLIENFTNKLENINLMEIVDYRYTSYGEAAAKASSQEKFLQSIHNILILKLEGTEKENEIKKGYPVRVKDGITKWGHSIPQFIVEETANPYRIVIIIDKLLEGKDLSEAINTIKELEKE